MLQRPRIACCIALLTLILQHHLAAAFIRGRLPAAAAARRAGVLRQHRALRMSSSADPSILLLSTTEDKASVNLLNALLNRGGWEPFEVSGLAGGKVWRRPDAPKPLFLWQIEQGFLRADSLDRQWTEVTKQPLQGASRVCVDDQGSNSS